MSGSRIDIRVFSTLVNQFLPHVSQHLENNYFSISLIVTKWILCFFIGILPTETTLQILDRFFLDGIVVIFKAMYVLVNQCQKKLLSCSDPGGISKTFEEELRTLFDYKNLLLNLSKLDQIELNLLETIRIQERKALEVEIQEIKKRRDMGQISKLTHCKNNLFFFNKFL